METFFEEQLYDLFWNEIKAQAKRANKEKVVHASIVDEERERKIAISSARAKTTSARAKRIEVRPLSRNATAIEIRGDINLDFEFDLRDDDLVGLKYDGKPVTLPQAAKKVLKLLIRMAKET